MIKPRLTNDQAALLVDVLEQDYPYSKEFKEIVKRIKAELKKLKKNKK